MTDKELLTKIKELITFHETLIAYYRESIKQHEGELIGLKVMYDKTADLMEAQDEGK